MSGKTAGSDPLAGFIESEGLDPSDFMFGIGGSYGGGLTPIDLDNIGPRGNTNYGGAIGHSGFGINPLDTNNQEIPTVTLSDGLNLTPESILQSIIELRQAQYDEVQQLVTEGLADGNASPEETRRVAELAAKYGLSADQLSEMASNAGVTISPTQVQQAFGQTGVGGMLSGVSSSIQDNQERLDPEKNDPLPEGYIRDDQGFVRDIATGQYWIIDPMGRPRERTAPLSPVSMPPITMTDGGGGGGGGGGGSTSATGGDSASTADTPSTGVDEGTPEFSPFDYEHPWEYDAETNTMRDVFTGQTVEIPEENAELFEDGGRYSAGDDGQILSTSGEVVATGTSEVDPEGRIRIIDLVGPRREEEVDVLKPDTGLDNPLISPTGVIAAPEPPVVTSVDMPPTDGGVRTTTTPGTDDGTDDGADDGTGGGDGTGDGTGGGDGTGSGIGSGIGTGLLLALSQQTPVTEQMFSKELFEPKMRELNNIEKALGMLQSIARSFV